MQKPNIIRVGRIVGTHGLKGQVKVEILTDFPERMDKGQRLRLKDDWVTVKAVQMHKNRLLMHLEGVNSIEAGQALQWEYLDAKVDELPVLEEGAYFTEDLIGMMVVSVDGEELGIVDEVLALPAQDVLKIGELMIPAVKEFVKGVDVEGRRITVKLIPGMREEAEE